MSDSLRILLVEDDEDDFVITRDALQEGLRVDYELTWCPSFATGLVRYQDTAPDICLVDYRLGANTGLDFLYAVREQSHQCPIIMLTGQGDLEIDQAAMEAGVADYLEKGILTSALLERAIRYAVERHKHQQAQRLASLVFQNTSEGILVTTPDYSIVTTNPRAVQLLQADACSLVGTKLTSWLPSEALQRFHGEVDPGIREQGVWLGELDVKGLPTDTFPALVNVNSIRDALGHVTHYVFLFTSLSLARKAQEKIDYLSHHDSLTGLPNAKHLRQFLQQRTAAGESSRSSLCLLNFAIERLETLNAALGWEVTNRLILSVIQRVQPQLPDGAFLARVSGQEFMLVTTCDDGHREPCMELARRMIAAMETPIRQDAVEAYVDLSIGIAHYPTDALAGEDLINHACAALHEARSRGDNQPVNFADVDRNSVQRHIRLEADLRKALERGELLLHYQPKVDLQTGCVTGAEALLRWNHPQEGMIPPLDFIPIAEKSTLILKIGEWVIQEACRQIRDWQQEGLSTPCVSVNVSARQFEEQDLYRLVSSAITQANITADMLELELTESMLLGASASNSEQLIALKALGVRLSLDDFGTGYSSLSVLHRLPVDILKIDRSFVTDVYKDRDRAKIIASIISLARSLDVDVVAEGVETLEEAYYLRKTQCQQMQGYLFSRPVSASEFAELLQSEKRLELEPVAVNEQRLLVVDDDPNVTSALRRALRREPYQVIVANTPSEALEILARQHVQVVLSDLRMPEMSGLDFLKMVKATHPQVTKAVISGYTDFDAIIDVLNRGDVFKFMTKPWDDERLREHIEDCFNHYTLQKNHSG